jgi:hypothetical protein
LSLKPKPHELILEETLKKVAEAHKTTIEKIKGLELKDKRSFHDDISIAVVNLGGN